MRTSGLIHIADETYITDRNNSRRELMPRVEYVIPNWDIDRAGSKGQVEIAAENGLLEANMWIATYRTVTPERGEVIRYPRGHWKLSRPGVAYDGSVEVDTGSNSERQTARGSDIIDDLAAAGLTETFYTPVGGNIMQDVYVAAKMATAGVLGPNLLTNGSFESGLAGWNVAWSSPGSNVASTATSFSNAPDRAYVIMTEFLAAAPSGSFLNPRSVGNQVAIPPGAQFLYASGLVRRTSSRIRNRMYFEFRDTSGPIASGFYSGGGLAHIPNLQWGRFFEVFPVPPGASHLWVGLENHLTAGGGAAYSYWDDIRVGTATMMPLPDSRFRLPESSAVASTRIQTRQDKSYGYDAINADRLSAIGHYALATDMEGRLTTHQIRTIGNTEPKYTFGPNHTPMMGGVVELPATSGSAYNHFRAVKEDLEDANNSMIAHSYNENGDDPFSVQNQGSVVSAPPEYVQDSISQAALQAVADGARDRFSMQEGVQFTVLDLPDLTVYDIVRIEDPSMSKANGLWAVESISPGDGGMVIGARRAIGGGS